MIENGNNWNMNWEEVVIFVVEYVKWIFVVIIS